MEDIIYISASCSFTLPISITSQNITELKWKGVFCGMWKVIKG